jgi:predicted dehydrogenase
MTTQVGILGFAHGHVNSYCTRWRENPDFGVQVVAGWDHDAERRAKFTGNLGIDACDSAEALVARADVDAVVIGAETSFHADMVELAAAAGKTIVLQKPMALTMEQADRIVAAVEKAGVRFTMCWQMRVDPQNLKMKELVESGEFGQIFMMRRRHGLPMCLNPDFADSWHVTPKYNRDIWADDSSHPIDMVHWMFGVPDSITAEVESLYNPRMPMDNGVAIFRYKGGPLVHVDCSFTNPACENTTEIIGEKGSIVQNFGDGPSCNVKRPEGGIPLKWYLKEKGEWTVSDLEAPPSHGNRIAHLAEPLSQFLAGTRGPIASAEEGRTSLRMVLACYVSSREGRRVTLDDPAIDQV